MVSKVEPWGVRHYNFFVWLLIAVLAAALSSCGYRFSGTGDLVPEGARSIAVPVFVNGTNEPYVDTAVTQAVIDEFAADGRLKVQDLSGADLALRGRVTAYSVTALSYTADAYVQQYKVRLVVEASLEEVRSKKILWQEKGIEAIFIADYPVAIGDIRSTRIVKEQAIQKASQDIAWTLRSRVLEGF